MRDGIEQSVLYSRVYKIDLLYPTRRWTLQAVHLTSKRRYKLKIALRALKATGGTPPVMTFATREKIPVQERDKEREFEHRTWYRIGKVMAS